MKVALKSGVLEIKPLLVCRCGSKCETPRSFMRHARKYGCFTSDELKEFGEGVVTLVLVMPKVKTARVEK